MSLTTCIECNARVTEGDFGIGHHPSCSYGGDVNDDTEDDARRWLESRPPAVRDAIERWPPTRPYRMRVASGWQDVQIISYSEDDDGSVTTCVVYVYGGAMTLPEPYEVFGVPLADLEAGK